MTLEQVLQIIEKKRCKVLENPQDPSWTEHFQDLKNEISNAWKSIGDVCITCAKCGKYHSVFTDCDGGVIKKPQV
jgi:hypothetical protein